MSEPDPFAFLHPHVRQESRIRLLERENAELRRDKARLDANLTGFKFRLTTGCVDVLRLVTDKTGPHWEYFDVNGFADLRSAIDAVVERK